MYFSSISELLDMGGHGAFVWSAYVMALGAIVAALFWVKLEQRQLKALLHTLQAETPPQSPQSALERPTP